MSGLRIHHLAIAARDPETLATFYERVFSLNRRRDANIAAGSVWLSANLDAGGQAGFGEVILMLEAANGSAIGASGDATTSDSTSERANFSTKQPGYHLLAFAMKPGERQGWRERLQSDGVVIEHESDYSIYFRDPEGNRIGLSHYPNR